MLVTFQENKFHHQKDKSLLYLFSATKGSERRPVEKGDSPLITYNIFTCINCYFSSTLAR